jgi:chemotaxis methyl-accepting protein methylase
MDKPFPIVGVGASAGGVEALESTDIDEAALSVARTGRYPDTLLQGVSKERLARFFTSEGSEDLDFHA